ncbi:MAG: DUF3987 domain-containing protein, partial [Pseudomonadota bacterium]
MNAPINRTMNEHKPIKPLPILGAAGLAEQFPIDALGETLGGAARALQDKFQVPDAMAGQSVLAAASLAAQAFADVQLPHGQTRPTSLFCVTVAESGDRKTTCDTQALSAVREYEVALETDYRIERATYEDARAIYENDRKQILKKNRDDRKEALSELKEPEEPLLPILLCTDPTIEGLQKALMSCQPAMGLFSDEGGSMLGGVGLNKDNKIKTAAGLSALWDGGKINRVRSMDGSASKRGGRLAAHLMVQPGVSHVLLADQGLADQGLLSRILVA